MGFGEWLSGAGSEIDKFLGGTGGQPISQPVQQDGPQQDVIYNEFGTAVATPIIPEARVEPVIAENQTVVTGGRDESGEYRPSSTDTSAPAKQSFAESYLAYDKSPEISRADYTKIADIGDSGTKDLVKSGYSPEQATALQRDKIIGDLVAKGYTKEQAAESREARYYQNEFDKAMQSKVALSSEYHHAAQDSGLAQDPNPFEHTGDLAKMALGKSQGVSNVPGTGLIPQFKGSLIEDANIVTKAARTGDMGDYGNLKNNTFSSGIGILDLSTKQAIGRTAAASALASGKEGPQSGWVVDENAMKKFTPELKKASGFDLFYREAKLENIGGGGGGGAGIEKNVSAISNIKSPGITKDTLKDYLLPEDMVSPGKSLAGVEKVGTGLVSTKSLAQGSDIMISQPPKGSGKNEILPPAKQTYVKSIIGFGDDAAVGNVYGIINPNDINTPGSILYNRQRGIEARNSMWSFPMTKRKPRAIPAPTPKKVSSFYRVTNEQIIPQTIGRDFFKFKVGSPTTSAKPSQIANFNKSNIELNFGVKLAKNASSTIKAPKLRSIDNSKLNKGSNVSVNVNSIMKKMSVKKIKVK